METAAVGRLAIGVQRGRDGAPPNGIAKLNFRMKIFPATFLLLWASGFVFLKVGLHYADPLTFLGLRYLCVVAVLLVPALSIKPTFPKTSRGWGALLAVGLFLQAGYFACTYLRSQLVTQ